MTLPLTPAVLEAAYAYLRETSPFKGWRLPHARQEITKTARRGGHNKEFHRLARRVCKVHGWDVRLFV